LGHNLIPVEIVVYFWQPRINLMNLLDYRFSKYSQAGQEGIILHILKMLNVTKGVFVEFGAWNGIKYSNCRLLAEKDWRGLFIEKSKKAFEELQNNTRQFRKVICYRGSVKLSGYNQFDNIIKRTLGNIRIEICSIDIDGPDFEIFETFSQNLPLIICIEGGQMLVPHHPRLPATLSKKNLQQSLQVMSQSFAAKGYSPVCSYQDTFFVKSEHALLFNVGDTTTLYFEGLEASQGRLPWISRKLKKNGLKNPIIDFVLKQSNGKGENIKEIIILAERMYRSGLLRE